MRVLIVDDEAAARHRLAIMLAELDVEVVGQAENGLEALKLVRERQPSVILLDTPFRQRSRCGATRTMAITRSATSDQT